MIVDPREIHRRLSGYIPDPSTDPNLRPGEAGPGPDGGAQPPPPASTGPSFWEKFLAAIKPYASDYDTIAGSQNKLLPLLNAGASAFGGEDAVLKYLGINPLKGIFSAMSYLNGTPYYDSSGVDENGNQIYKPFYIPGFDYDPNTPGIQGPSWLAPYTGQHAYKT